jgi:hypothetical protein
LLLSSTYFTHAKWTGFVACLANGQVKSMPRNEEIMEGGENSSSIVMLSSLKTSQQFKSGITVAQWLSDEHVLVASDIGELQYMKFNLENPNTVFESVANFREHDHIIRCLETKFNSQLAITASDDAV